MPGLISWCTNNNHRHLIGSGLLPLLLWGCGHKPNSPVPKIAIQVFQDWQLQPAIALAAIPSRGDWAIFRSMSKATAFTPPSMASPNRIQRVACFIAVPRCRPIDFGYAASKVAVGGARFCGPWPNSASAQLKQGKPSVMPPPSNSPPCANSPTANGRSSNPINPSLPHCSHHPNHRPPPHLQPNPHPRHQPLVHQ